MIQTESIPHENKRMDNQTEGRIILSTMLEGTSNRQYGGKNRVTAVLYCRPVRLRSVLSPAIRALPLIPTASVEFHQEQDPVTCHRDLHVTSVDESNQVQHLNTCSAMQDGSIPHLHLQPKVARVLCRPSIALSCLQQELVRWRCLTRCSRHQAWRDVRCLCLSSRGGSDSYVRSCRSPRLSVPVHHRSLVPFCNRETR
jgi:hypothetical protein